MKIAQGVSDQGHRSRQNGRSAPWPYDGGMFGPSEQSLRATPFVYRPPETLPRREWLYGRQYIRRFVSGTVASGGMGKSALVLVEAIAMVTGRDLLGHRPRGKFRVWYINGEDPRDEIDRRIGGILLRYGIAREEIEGRLFVDSGRDRDFTLVVTNRDGVQVCENLCQAIEAEIKANSIDVLVIDPLISALRIAENDNNAMDVAIKRLARNRRPRGGIGLAAIIFSLMSDLRLLTPYRPFVGVPFLAGHGGYRTCSDNFLAHVRSEI
jgi:hypothetical protein